MAHHEICGNFIALVRRVVRATISLVIKPSRRSTHRSEIDSFESAQRPSKESSRREEVLVAPPPDSNMRPLHKGTLVRNRAFEDLKQLASSPTPPPLPPSNPLSFLPAHPAEYHSFSISNIPPQPFIPISDTKSFNGRDQTTKKAKFYVA